MTTSCQPSRPQPHASGIAATSATSGMATKTPTRTRWKVEDGSSSNSDLAERNLVLLAPSTGLPAPVAVGDEAWTAVGTGGCAGEIVTSAALTVSGDVVIVLLWNRR